MGIVYKRIWISTVFIIAGLVGCTSHKPVSQVGRIAPRTGDEIIVCGQLVHTGTPVVMWMDPGGFDGYRVERRFASMADSDWADSSKAVKELKTPNRYGLRKASLTDEQIEQVRGGGWPLDLLRDKIDQFVLHYDVSGTSRQCFAILHDHRDLSVHFMLDLDGTIYQTLDLKERAWHATIANDRSIGIEIANIGAYGLKGNNPLADWYRKDPQGHTRVVIPLALGGGKYLHTSNFIPRPARELAVIGKVQGTTLQQYDLTPQQYQSLIHLTATLCTVFPKLKCDYPRDAKGALIIQKLDSEQFANYQGILGHYHVQSGKVDPGPAMQWDYLVNEARGLMSRAK